MSASPDNPIRYRVTVPGKVMLAGEYSVLKGFPALASTVNSQMTVDISASSSNECQVTSNIWQAPKQLFLGTKEAPEDMLLRCIRDCLEYFAYDQGVNLDVASGFKITHGIGSSSALRVAVFLAIEALTGQVKTRRELIDFCLTQQRLYQKRASGYDIATQALGGTVIYELAENDFDVKPVRNLAYDHFFCLVNEAGAPTDSMMQSMGAFISENTKWAQEFHRLNLELFQALHGFTSKNSSPQSVIAAMADFRQHTEATPMFIKKLANLRGRGLDIDWSFKTTGAGGEDAVLVFSASPIDASIKKRVLSAFRETGFVEAPFRLADSKPMIEQIGAIL